MLHKGFLMLNSRCQIYLNEGETLFDLEKRLQPITINNSKWLLGNTYCYSTPIMRGYGVSNLSPFACVIITPSDTLQSLSTAFQRFVHYTSAGSGISLYLGNIRSIGSFCNKDQLVHGIMPFVRMADATICAIRQDSMRDGAGIVWLNVDHPEIESFLEIGDPKSPIQKLKTGVVITNKFMQSVKTDKEIILQNSREYYEKYPKCNSRKRINAKLLLNKIAAARLRKGNPSIFFQRDTKVMCPNLCCEVLLDTREHEIEVCCLATVNIFEFMQNTKLDKDELYNLMSALVEKLQEIRKSSYIHGGKSVGVGIAGVFDAINSICLDAGLNSKYFIDALIEDLILVLQRLKQEYPNDPITAIAPNTYTSYVMGCSPGISPRSSINYTKHFSRIKSNIHCPIGGADSNELFYLFNINKHNKHYQGLEHEQVNTNLMEYVVSKLTPFIDQGISCSTIYDIDEDETVADTLRRHTAHIEKLYDAGFKTIYYHSTRTNKLCKLGEQLSESACSLCEN